MRTLILSNAPFCSSGYGNQTDVFSRQMVAHGHEVVIAGFYGHRGTIFTHNGITVLPGSLDEWGNDIIGAHWNHYRPDVTVFLVDIWVYHKDVLNSLPVTAWAPIDHQPMPPQVARALEQCSYTWAMSRFAEREMRRLGFDPFYVPHGVELNVYRPLDRAKAREAWGIKPGQFFACMVAANKGFPSRKSLDKVFKAWGYFIEKHPDALLYVHALPTAQQHGLDLSAMASFYGIPDDNLRFPDDYRLLRGDYKGEQMNALYNAADVLLAPSMGEGFGIPVIEAQAAGCPVVVSDFSAQSELGEVGYKIPIDPMDDRAYTLAGSEQCSPKVSEILKGMEWAFEHQNDTALRTQAFAFAQQYDASRIYTRYMQPAMEVIAAQTADMFGKVVRPKVEVTPKKPLCETEGHVWSPTGVYDKDGNICVPCKRPECAAELRQSPNGLQVLIGNGFGTDIDGIHLDIEDDPDGGVAKIICREISELYAFDTIEFNDGDVILDIGAQVGIVSCYLGKKYPNTKIYAFEPVPENYRRLLRNLQANNVTNVTAINKALSSDGRTLALSGDLRANSGGISALTTPNGHPAFTVESVTLASIFEDYAINRVKLLKIDCEGAEYEILLAKPELLDCIDYMRGEFHVNQRILDLGYNPDKLMELCEAHLSPERVLMVPCQISA